MTNTLSLADLPKDVLALIFEHTTEARDLSSLNRTCWSVHKQSTEYLDPGDDYMSSEEENMWFPPFDESDDESLKT